MLSLPVYSPIFSCITIVSFSSSFTAPPKIRSFTTFRKFASGINVLNAPTTGVAVGVAEAAGLADAVAAGLADGETDGTGVPSILPVAAIGT